MALIGIYGSCLTGDIHSKSDLDLLILINDDRGWQLASTFIQDDVQIGHDLYCTTWENLEYDAHYPHPNISKLMDSTIVYCADEEYRKRLEALRAQAAAIVNAPLCREDLAKAEALLKDGEHHYARALIAEEKADRLDHIGHLFFYIENAIAMLNKTYFHYGTKRVFDELEAMQYRPDNLRGRIEAVLNAVTVHEQSQHLTALMGDVIRIFEQAKCSLTIHKQEVTPNVIRGTYEEMFSNWRNKMYYAFEHRDVHLSFMSMCAMNDMMQDIAGNVQIGQYPVLDHFEADDLLLTAKNYDRILDEYQTEYEKAGIPIKHYRNMDAFIEDYLKKETA